MQHYFRNTLYIWLLLFFLAVPAYSTGDPGSAATGETVEQQLVSLRIPLFSAHFADTPVALVNEEPVTLNELAEAVESREGQEPGHAEGKKTPDPRDVLQRIIQSRLIVQEAKNIGLDETDQIQDEVEQYRIRVLLQKLINTHLDGLEPDPADVADVYHQISREVQLYTLIFDKGSEARQFREEVMEGDFEQMAARYIEGGRAEGEMAEEYVKIKDLLPQVGQQVHSMEEGDVSTVYRSEKGFVLFQVIDTRFVEDPPVEKEAVRIVLDSLRKQKAMEYSNTLTEKYVDFNEELYQQLDFDKDFQELKKDQRVLATVEGDIPRIITVADLAAKMQSGIFHGVDKAQKLQMLNKRKDVAISNMLFRITGELEARRLGLDQADEFVERMERFKRSILFKAFMEKVILPEVKLTPEEVREYYEEHLDDYSSPTMLRMNSLVFTKLEEAEDALDKLRKGADFQWVSANVSGFVPSDTEGVLPFDDRLLSLSSLPSDLQNKAEGAKKGESLLYEGSGGEYIYVLYLEDVFPPEPQPFEQARDEVARAVFDRKAQKLVDEWVGKLKEVYETRVFMTGMEQ